MGMNLYIYIYVIIIISNIVNYLSLGNFTFSINRIVELRANYTFFGYLIENLLKNIYINKLNMKFSKIYIVYLKQNYMDIECKIINDVNNYKLNLLSQKKKIFKEIKNKPTNFINTELCLLFDEGCFNIFIWKGLYLNENKFEGRALLVIKTLYKMDILKIKISLFLIWSLDHYYEYSSKIDVVQVGQDFVGRINSNSENFREKVKKKSEEKNFFLPFFDYDNNKSLWNSIFLLYYDESFNDIIDEGLYLWDLINNDETLTEERIKWFNNYIEELKIEWLHLKNNHNNIKKIIKLLLSEYTVLEIDLYNLNNKNKKC